MRAPPSVSWVFAEGERIYESVNPDVEPEWARFIDPAYLNGEHANTLRDIGDNDRAAEFARRSIAYAASQQRARRGAMSQAALAASHLQKRDLEAAHAAGVRTIKLSRQVKSSRCIEAVQDLKRRMVPYGKHQLVADFNERARDLLAA